VDEVLGRGRHEHAAGVEDVTDSTPNVRSI
jgi:hypothetical protein